MSIFEFPDDFYWGAATSSHQIEGNNQNNDWYFAEQANKVPQCGMATDSKNLYNEDVELIKTLSCNSYRFSVEWSRIQPDPNSFDDNAVEYYRNIIKLLLENNITPIITLNHFTIPQWFAQIGGWESSKAHEFFTNYVDFITDAFKDLDIPFWLTINEPLVYVFNAYIVGIWPPFITDIRKAFRVIENLKKAHFCAYHAIKQIKPEAHVSFAKHYRWFRPCSCGFSLLNKFSSCIRDHFFNKDFMDYAHYHKCMDFIALNYYTGEFVKGGLLSLIGDSCSCHADRYVLNGLGWFNTPYELEHALIRYSKFDLPIFITENGTTAHRDSAYEEYLLNHLRSVALAMEKGADVIGYLYWSLLDNYEWAEGYNAHFGLFDKDRKRKKFADVYADICKTNKLEF